MDVSAAAISGQAKAKLQGAVSITMLKKTQDLVATQMMDLLQAIPQSPSPSGVGGNIDVRG